MPDQQSELARAIQDVTQQGQLLVREEIALAKAELADKAVKLRNAAIFGAIAGVFAVFSLIYILDAVAWGIWEVLGIGDGPWIGFLITGVVILITGAILGMLAFRFAKRGSPPTPQMAIEEAQHIKATLTAAPASHTVGPVGARQAPEPAPVEGER